MVKLYLAFFEVLSDDLLATVEDSRLKGQVNGAMNATFMALIPKKDKWESWNDFHPISLCNLVYKIITKILSNWIKSTLSKCMTKEQFGFLDGRQILDTIAST
jgi:hypothetical protein